MLSTPDGCVQQRGPHLGYEYEWPDEETDSADAKLHRPIAESAHNGLQLMNMFDVVNTVR
jgi:hypothetical protein